MSKPENASAAEWLEENTGVDFRYYLGEIQQQNFVEGEMLVIDDNFELMGYVLTWDSIKALREDRGLEMNQVGDHPIVIEDEDAIMAGLEFDHVEYKWKEPL
tara:strand:- start:11879 stop:12184 length:306 start_codon:yes stop_codon:yes gene_type:complete